MNLERPEVPVELATVAAKMMAKDPAKRYQTPVEVAQALMPFIKPGTKSAAGPSHELLLAEAKPAKGPERVYTHDAPPPPRRRPPVVEPTHVAAEVIQETNEQNRSSTARPKSGKVKGLGTKGIDAAHIRARWSGKKRPPLPWLVGMAGSLLAVFLGGIVLLWPTPQGVVKIESDDPNVEVMFDATGPTVKGADKEPIALQAGEHGILVKRGDFEFEADKFVLRKGDTLTLKVERLPGKIQLVQDGKVIGSRDIAPSPIPTVPAPVDALRREQIPPDELAAAGGGDANRAPPELVAVLGDSRLNHWAWFAPTWIGACALSYSRDGKRLATASVDGSARLWDTETGKLLRSFEGHEGPVSGVALSPDGMILATVGSDDRTVKLWEAGNGRLRLSLDKQASGISCLAFSPDGKLLAGAIRDGAAQVCIWEAATGRSRRVISVPINLWSVVFSPDGKTVAAGGGRWWGSAEGRGWVRLFDLDTGNERHVLMGHREPVTSVAFSPDGKTLASTSWDQTARLWDCATGQEIRELKGHGNRVLRRSLQP